MTTTVVRLVDGGLTLDSLVDLVIGDLDAALLDLVLDDLLADGLVDQVLAILLDGAIGLDLIALLRRVLSARVAVVLAVGDVVGPSGYVDGSVGARVVAHLLRCGLGDLVLENLAVGPRTGNLLAAASHGKRNERRQSRRNSDNGNLLDDSHEASSL